MVHLEFTQHHVHADICHLHCDSWLPRLGAALPTSLLSADGIPLEHLTSHKASQGTPSAYPEAFQSVEDTLGACKAYTSIQADTASAYSPCGSMSADWLLEPLLCPGHSHSFENNRQKCQIHQNACRTASGNARCTSRPVCM